MITSKFGNLSTDNTLGGSSPSDETVSSQKAVKEYVDNNSGLKNTATGGTSIYPSLTILGNDGNVTGSLNIGQQTSIAAFATAVGIAATANGYGGTAFGNSARAGRQYSTSLGYHSNTSNIPGVNSTAVGALSYSTGEDSVAVGYGTYANNSHAIAIGSGANATASNGAIQLGYGTNNSAGTFNVGFYSSSDPKNYQLLKYNGIIPLERMPYTAGANISISSTGEISATGGGSPDNLSITTNTNSELQAVGVIDQNNTTTAIKTWTGTLAEYTAITTKDANTLYNITDESESITFANTDVSNLTSSGKNIIAKLAMPSSKYDDLTLGASASSYTVPANGYFFFAKHCLANQYIFLTNNTSRLRSRSVAPSESDMEIWLPCMKNDRITIAYSATGSTMYFRFVYAEGDNV